MTDKGYELLRQLEGFRNAPYLDSAGVATVGYGNTWYLDGTRVRMSDAPITIKQATELLQAIVATFEASVRNLVKVALEPHQMDALIIFAYNVGTEAFKKSTLLKVVNIDPTNYDAIKVQLLRWVNAGGKIVTGLKKRRNREFYYYANNVI